MSSIHLMPAAGCQTSVLAFPFVRRIFIWRIFALRIPRSTLERAELSHLNQNQVRNFLDTKIFFHRSNYIFFSSWKKSPFKYFINGERERSRLKPFSQLDLFLLFQLWELFGNFFLSTSLPLASARVVWSTLLNLWSPLCSHLQRCQKTLIADALILIE